MEEIFIIIVLVVIVVFKKSIKSSVKGKIGERKAENSLIYSLDIKEYKILNDIYLPTKYGTTQIDHIIVSKYGIFVIETKYYAGKIYGSEYAEYWTQYLPKTQNKIYNPIKQNLGHIVAVSKIIEKETIVYPISIIAIKNSARIKVKSQTPVIKISNLGYEVKKYKDIVLTDAQVNTIYGLINENNVLDEDVRKAHKQNVKNYVRNKKYK